MTESLRTSNRVSLQAPRYLSCGYLVRLHPQQFGVLLLLLERAGQIVSREELHQHIWGNDTFVDFERGINFFINQICAALGDDADRPRYVERFWDYARSLENAFSFLG